MNTHRIAIAAALALIAAPLSAQDHATAAPPDDDAEIVVEAPRSLPAAPPPPGERAPGTGAPTMVLTMRIPVLFGDLDLGTAPDRERLETRVRNVAAFACRELDRAYPLTSDPDCLRTAIASADRALKAKLASVPAR